MEKKTTSISVKSGSAGTKEKKNFSKSSASMSQIMTYLKLLDVAMSPRCLRKNQRLTFYQSDADLAKWESERTWHTGSYPGGLLDTGAMADAAKDYDNFGKLYGPEDYVRAQVAAYTLVREVGDGEQ